MRRGPAELNPAQAIAQRMRTMEADLHQARQALRRDRKRSSLSDRWGLEQATTESLHEEGWFITYLDMMTLLLVAMIVMLAFSGSIGKRMAVPDSTTRPDAPPAVALAPIPAPDEAFPYSAEDAARAFNASPPAEPEHSPLFGTFPDFEPETPPVPVTAVAAPMWDEAAAPLAESVASPAVAPAPSPQEAGPASPSAAESAIATEPVSMASPVPAPAATAEPRSETGDAPPSPVPAPANDDRAASAAAPASATDEPSEGAVLAASLPLGELGHDVEVIVNRRSISFRINSEILFGTGQADLSREGLSVLRRMAKVLSDAGYDITVEGHTDSVPVRSNARYPSNWELSGARAGSVVRYLQANGIAKGHLKAVGYADARPIADNRSPDGRARNRRVELVVEKPHGDLDQVEARPAG
ncbi:OmpA family protein [Castellaniella sp. WN]